MKQAIKINNIALWKPAAGLKEGESHFCINPAGRTYLEKGSSVFKLSDKLMYRYVKNYKAGKTSFSLFVRTFRDEENAVIMELDAVAKKVKESEAKAMLAEPDYMKFKYLDIYLKEEK